VLPPTIADANVPSIALVTPSYQQGRYINDTIASVLNQHYPKLEYHVQDGGSSDETTDVLRLYDGLFTWDSRRDSGQSHAINEGFTKVRGEIMGYLNSDDILLPGALATVGRYFAQHPDVDVIYGDRIVIDEAGREIGNWRLPKHSNNVLSWADFIPQETLFWRRSAWERAGGSMSESFAFALDWDLINRMRDAGATFVHIPRFIGGFRVHGSQKTLVEMGGVGLKEMTQIRVRSLGYQPTREQVRWAVAPYLLAHLAIDLRARAGDCVSRSLRPLLRRTRVE
jgi:glycosyltransferase involved in cell wall biosynthesis